MYYICINNTQLTRGQCTVHFVFYSSLLRLPQALLRITNYETHCLNVVYMKPIDIQLIYFFCKKQLALNHCLMLEK